ncbi:MAG TPA: DUF47 family protein [Thermoprotei archaeon]|nr:DUF47 family protein [Thermoprotei archaeon]
MRLFKRRLDRAEDKMLKLVIDHADYCRKCVKSLAEAIFCLSQGERSGIEELLREVHRAEEQADEVRRRVIEEVAKGVVPPLSREDFIRLVERVDMVADWARNAARILEVELIQDTLAEDNFSNILYRMVSLISSCVEVMERAIEMAVEDFDECLKLLHRVEEIEEEVDSLYVKSLEALCSMRATRPTYSLLAERLVETLENICDAAEDAGDVLKVIIVRALK